MSWLQSFDPERDGATCPDALEMVIVPRTADIGGFEVRRVLPFRDRRMVGPFIFWDEMGPGFLKPGDGIDVLPHPHIGLSTVTFLTSGSLDHRDSLGTHQTILPGAVNLMTAGRGIVHSERSDDSSRAGETTLAGIQSWLALPKDAEEQAPTFSHTTESDLPVIEDGASRVRVILGSAYGETSPVPLTWDTLYLDVALAAGETLPLPTDTEERAIYGLRGEIEVAGVRYPSQRMLVLRSGAPVTIVAHGDCRLLVLGGAVMDGPRHIWWNFVSSSRDRIETAKHHWREQAFDRVPGDESEFVPLPN